MRIYELDETSAAKRVYELAEWLQCRDLLETQLRRLSLGERMKMELIGSLLHQPEVLFLDEPTIGLDVVAQNRVRDFLQHYVKLHQPTVLLTSHYMDDIAKLADRLLLIRTGSVVYDGTVDNFTKRAYLTQKLTAGLNLPLTQSFVIQNKEVARPGDSWIECSLVQEHVPEFLKKLADLGTLESLKIQETDFEEVIRRFLSEDVAASHPA
jgi:ABC-2 type transport system ATP-binding protein